MVIVEDEEGDAGMRRGEDLFEIGPQEVAKGFSRAIGKGGRVSLIGSSKVPKEAAYTRILDSEVEPSDPTPPRVRIGTFEGPDLLSNLPMTAPTFGSGTRPSLVA